MSAASPSGWQVAQGCDEAPETVLQRGSTENEEPPSAMVVPRRRRKREVREMMNGHGFMKRMARCCRGRRDLPRGGGDRRRNATVWPEKLAGSSPKT